MTDLLVSVTLFSLTALIALAFTLARRRRGEIRYDRVDAVGDSAMLGRGAMTGAYWMLQPIARALVSLGFSANGVTLTAMGLAAAAALSLATGHFGWAALFVSVASLGDALDGLVARLKGESSRAGSVLDATVDRYSEFLFLAALAVYFRAELGLMLLAIAALLGALMTSYASIRAEALGVKVPRGAMRRPERAVYLAVGVALTPFTQLGLAGASTTLRHLPVLVAMGIVAAVANVSAVRRTRALMQSLNGDAEAVRREPPVARTLARHQLGALAATASDFGTMIALVDGCGLAPTAATAMGAFTGATVNFNLARRWVFNASGGDATPQVARYALVSGASLGLNTLGEHFAVGHLHSHYLGARVAVALAVSLMWNFPLQRHFVFAGQAAPCRH